MNRTFTALTVAAALSVGSMAAADGHSPTMGEGFDMLQAALVSDFEDLGIPTDALNDLTLGQIAAIKQIVESGDSEGQKRGRIEAIVGN